MVMLKISWIIVAIGPLAFAGSSLKLLKSRGRNSPVKTEEIIEKNNETERAIASRIPSWKVMEKANNKTARVEAIAMVITRWRIK